MQWTEKYFMSQYLAEVIVCVIVLVAVAIGGVVWLIEKIKDKFDRKLAERTERRLNERNGDR
jgi:uncharacterized alkaline shock family protein YloU